MKLYDESFCFCKFKNPKTLSLDNVKQEFISMKEHETLEIVKLYYLLHNVRNCQTAYVQTLAHHELILHQQRTFLLKYYWMKLTLITYWLSSDRCILQFCVELLGHLFFKFLNMLYYISFEKWEMLKNSDRN